MPTELIEPEEQTQLPVWAPLAGRELERFLARKPGIAGRLKEEALRVLGACVQPGKKEQTAGLVLGYVQSGKTSSFTAVSALARDNGYKLVIVIGGVSHILLNQTIKRLREDLSLAEGNAFQRWIMCEKPGADDAADSGALLRRYLRSVIDGTQMHPGIALVAAMKERTNLAKLIAVLREAQEGNPNAFSGITALIIDDEAHMHTPDVGKAKKSGEDYTPSKIYTKFRELRSLFPSHTLLQYTATPQANLVAALQDELSPDFVKLLQPGSGYTGGRYFFSEGAGPAIRIIPEGEVSALQDDMSDEPPASLQQSLASFVIVCANDHLAQQEIATHSMLVHSDVKTDVHRRWHSWLLALTNAWQALLRPGAHPEDREVLAAMFRSEYAELKRTAPGLREFSEIMDTAAKVLANMHVKLVNSKKYEKIDYTTNPYWVLCGGNMLGVGYTVEGICTTHMVRPAGQRQIDTIQQRGRFFGYLQNPDRCRVWVTADVSSTFADYVQHEEALRSSLAEFDKANKPLRTWQRAFFIDPRSRLTRAIAIRLELSVGPLNNWTMQRERNVNTPAVQANRALVAKFLAKLSFAVAPQVSGSTSFTQHKHAQCTLELLREFLVDYKFAESDAKRFTVIKMLLGIEKYTRELQQCSVYHMAAGLLPNRRTRTVSEEGRVDIHQGRGDKGADKRPNDSTYKGDAHVHHPSCLSLQVFSYDLEPGPKNSDDPFVALWMPESLLEAAGRIRATPDYHNHLD